MASPWTEFFAPAVGSEMSQGIPGYIQGYTQGTNIQQKQALAALEQLQAQFSMMQQSQQFPLQLQKMQQDFAQQQKMNPLLLKEQQAKTAKESAQAEREHELAQLYKTGGMFPARNIKEQAQRLMAAGDFENPIVQNYLASLTKEAEAHPTAAQKEAKDSGMSTPEWLKYKSQFRPTAVTIMDPTDPTKAIVVDAKTGKRIGESPRLAEGAIPFAVKKKFLTDLGSGVIGRQVIAYNTAIAHLNLLRDYAHALNTGDVQAVNRLMLAIQKQFNLSTAPATFDAIVPLVAGEIMKTVAVSGGGVEERLAASRAISSTLSPETLESVLQGEVGIIEGKVEAIGQQYKAITGKDDFSKQFITSQGQSTSKSTPTDDLQRRAYEEFTSLLASGVNSQDAVAKMKKKYPMVKW